MDTTESTKLYLKPVLVSSQIPMEDYVQLVDLARRHGFLRSGRPNISAAVRIAIARGLEAFAADAKMKGEGGDG